MPADNGVRLNDRQSIANSGEQPIETNEYQTVDGTEGKFLWSSPPQDVYLLPQRPDLCLERCARPEQIDDCPTNKSAKVPHPTTGLPDSRSTASQMRFATGTAVCPLMTRSDIRPDQRRRPVVFNFSHPARSQSARLYKLDKTCTRGRHALLCGRSFGAKASPRPR
jgi:hypothetical protein